MEEKRYLSESDYWHAAHRRTLVLLRECEEKRERLSKILRRIDARVIDMVDREGMPFDLLYEIHEMIGEIK